MTSYVIMLDATGSSSGNIPARAPKIAGYVTGSGSVPWLNSDWTRFPDSGKVRIDQSPSLSAWAAGAADIADVENGAGTTGTAVEGALERKAKGWLSFVYVAGSNLAGMQSAMNAAGLAGHVQYWVADWSLNEAEAASKLTGDIVAIQYASPTSNPDMPVPGGTQALLQANIDVSVTIPSWFAFIPPKPVSTGVVVTADYKTILVTSRDEITWTVASI